MLTLLKPTEFATARETLAKLDIEQDAKSQLLTLLERCEANNAAMASKLISADRLKNMVFGKRTEHLGPTLFEQSEVFPSNEVPTERKAETTPDLPRGRSSSGRGNLRFHAQAEVISCSCTQLTNGASCPGCRCSKVYVDKPLQKTVVQCVNLVVTQVFELENLRCRSCGYVETAEAPAVASECIGKYHFSAIAHLAVLRYHAGLPSHRMQNLTGMLGLSVPETTQFKLFDEAANRLLPLLHQIKNSIANAAVSFRDDSPMRILEIDPETNTRKSVTVTALVGLQDDKKFILYETSTKHAGEVYGKVMARQAINAPPL